MTEAFHSIMHSRGSMAKAFNAGDSVGSPIKESPVLHQDLGGSQGFRQAELFISGEKRLVALQSPLGVTFHGQSCSKFKQTGNVTHSQAARHEVNDNEIK
eukprot:scaffold31529_cov25-Prasinocladus_malaysianus.AAC.1